MSRVLPAISLHDPWATLLVTGRKTIESRRGPVLSGFTGPIVVHRTLQPSDAEYMAAHREFPGAVPPEEWPADTRGLCLGIVGIEHTYRCEGDGTAGERLGACYHDLRGRWLSIVMDPWVFPRPFAARGRQGRWKVEVPDDLLPRRLR